MPLKMVSKDANYGVHRKEETMKYRPATFYRRHTRLITGSLLVCLVLFWFWTPRGKVPVDGDVREEYSVVFDAGSTGSRIHVYRFSVESGGGLVLKHDDFHQTEPGLSFYAGRPMEAAESLSILLDAVQSSIPLQSLAETPCQLKATAGLRLLAGNQAEEILSAVQEKLARTDYSIGPNAVSILDGRYEGAYAWLTLNYLLEK